MYIYCDTGFYPYKNVKYHGNKLVKLQGEGIVPVCDWSSVKCEVLFH